MYGNAKTYTDPAEDERFAGMIASVDKKLLIVDGGRTVRRRRYWGGWNGCRPRGRRGRPALISAEVTPYI